MKHRIEITAIMAALLFAAAGCQLHPRPTEVNAEPLPPAPTPALPYHVSDMRIQTLPAVSYLHGSTRTSFEDISTPASQMIAALRRLTESGAVHQDSPILFVYHDPSENPGAPFDLDIGLPVHPAPTTTPPSFALQTLPAFRCATVIYRGPMNLLPRAYNKLLPDMIAAGLVPSEETRESYIVWESPDSPGNVVQIEVGIRE